MPAKNNANTQRERIGNLLFNSGTIAVAAFLTAVQLQTAPVAAEPAPQPKKKPSAVKSCDYPKAGKTPRSISRSRTKKKKKSKKPFPPGIAGYPAPPKATSTRKSQQGKVGSYND